jgi:hypothetical protein
MKKMKDKNAETRETENEKFRIKSKSDYNIYQKQEQIYINNITRAYALFWDRYTKCMRNNL